MVTGPGVFEQHLAVPATCVGLFEPMGQVGCLANGGAGSAPRRHPTAPGHRRDAGGPLVEPTVVIGGTHHPGTFEDVHQRRIQPGGTVTLAEDGEAVDSGRETQVAPHVHVSGSPGLGRARPLRKANASSFSPR